MKKAKKTSAKKKKAAKPAAKKTTKAAKTSSKRAAPKPDLGSYTPQPIQGIGWAPFRYPLS